MWTLVKTSRTSYRTNRGFAVPVVAKGNCRVNPVTLRPIIKSRLAGPNLYSH